RFPYPTLFRSVEQVEFAVVAVFQQSRAAGDEAAGGCVKGTGDAVEGVHARGAALLELFDGVGVHARLFGEALLGEAVEHAVFADAVSDMLHEYGPAFPGGVVVTRIGRASFRVAGFDDAVSVGLARRDPPWPGVCRRPSIPR